MKERIIFVLLLLSFIFSGSVIAQNKSYKSAEVDKIFGSNNVICFSFVVAGKDKINNDLTRIISIDNVKALPDDQGYQVRAYANKQEFQKFLQENISYTMIKPAGGEKSYTMATTMAQMTANWACYPTYNLYEQMMVYYATTYPLLCHLDTILSSTVNGHNLVVLKISDSVNIEKNKPHFLYTSSMHGDETTGYVLMLHLIDYLVTNYGTIAKVTNLVNNAEIWICPLANPDGTYLHSDILINATSSQRYNGNNIDLNRNYPDPIYGPNPDGNAWQPETQAFMTFADNHNINMSINFHGGSEVNNYPWDSWTTVQNPNADALWWQRVCIAYVDTARLVLPTYMSDVTSSGVTEGADWYYVTGGRQDYMNYFKHCREETVELDETKTTQTQNLPARWNQNYRSFLNYIQESLYGVRGLITDSCTGQPIRAKVWANNHDQANDSSEVYSALPVGNYHKYMIAGTYNITYSAPGYVSKTVNGIVLNNGAATVVNVLLRPASIVTPSASFTDSIAGLYVSFTNTSANATSCLWKFGDGATSSQTNPSHTYAGTGTFNVVLITYNTCSVDSVTIPVSVTTVGGVFDRKNMSTAISISPNPARGIINLSFQNVADGNCKIEVINLVGEKLRTITVHFTQSPSNASLDLTTLCKGIYFIKFTIDGQSTVRKVIIE